MKLRYKITGSLLALLLIGITVLGVVLSHNSACESAPELSAKAEPMKAIMNRCYGSPDVLTLENVEKPEPADNEVLVKVKAAAVNPLDWHYMRGSPYIMRLMGAGIGKPVNQSMGVDFAGTVEAVGKNVNRFKPGDDVFWWGKWCFCRVSDRC